MQIGILEIKRHHPPTSVKTLQNKDEGFQAELQNTKKYVESAEVENGEELTSVFSGQEIVGLEPSLVQRYLDMLHGHLQVDYVTTRDETFSHRASRFECSLDNGVSTGERQSWTPHKRKKIPMPDHLEDKLVRGNLLLGSQEKREPATHREGAYLGQTEPMSPQRPRRSRWADPSTPSPTVGRIGGDDMMEVIPQCPRAGGLLLETHYGLLILRLSLGSARPPDIPVFGPTAFSCWTFFPWSSCLNGWRGERRGSSPLFLRLLAGSRGRRPLGSPWASRG